MKKPVEFFRWRPFLVMLFLSLCSLAIWGQEETVETSPTTSAKTTGVTATNNEWYTSPWLWVIGVAVVVLVMVALLSSRNTTEKVRASKTIKEDSNTNGL